MKVPLFLLFMCSLTSQNLAAADGEAYPRTSPGEIEIKNLPAARLMTTQGSQPYFSGSNKLFGKLFGYINTNKIPMTTPVEARMSPAVMIFYMDSTSANRTDLGPTEEIQLQNLPARLVAAIGIRGSYSQENYLEGLERLQQWVVTQPQLEVVGAPYAVYWNSPFVPFFFKQSEVHLPVRQKK